jgi:D-serine dehydratase
MKKQPSNPDQLCFSIGRPLRVLLEEVQKNTRNPDLRKATAQILEGLDTLKVAKQTGLSKSSIAQGAIYEILTKETLFTTL